MLLRPCLHRRGSIAFSHAPRSGQPRSTRPSPRHQRCRPSSSIPPTKRKTIFSGIQPTGIPHLGNYLGALQQWVHLQNSSAPDTTNLIYSLVDLHAITVRQPPAQLREWKKDSLAVLLAIGLDPSRCTIFHQSDVPAHAELMWILSCQASTGYLSRMTQWKDKTSTSGSSGGSSEKLKLGLFSYPVLQAADILVHAATHVPVGHDQAQHLEFAREIALSFNHVYGGGEDILTPPETLVRGARRVMSLANPAGKMSKSDGNERGRIMLTDSEETIRGKVRAAITDSEAGLITYEPVKRPGVSNMIDLLFYCQRSEEGLGGWKDQEGLARDLQGLTFKALKERVADAVEGTVRPIREAYALIRPDEQLLQDVAVQGAEKARQSAAPTLEGVKQAVGLI